MDLRWPRIGRGVGLAAAMTVVSLLVVPVVPAAEAAQTVRSVGQLTVLNFGSHPGHATHPDRAVSHNPTRDLLAHRLAKQRASARLQPASTGTTSPASAALFNNLSQPGLAVTDEGFCCTPPDPTGAIGPNHYVEMVNDLVGVYDRNNLSLLSSMDLAKFVTASSGTLSDPQIEFDFTANRWFYLAVDFDITNNNNYLVFGWSKTSDPSDLSNGWCRFGVFTGRTLNDFPKLGHDDNYLLFGSNIYDDSDLNTEISAQIWAYRKPANGDASCNGTGVATYFADATHVLHNSDGTPADTPVPANTTESSMGGYIVAAHSALTAPAGPRNKIMVWHMTMQSSSPVLVADGDISVNSYDVPADVPQPQNSLDTLDGQLTQAVARQDPDAGGLAIWTQHTVGGAGGRSVVRWYELLPASLGVRQEGEIASPTNFIFNGAISTTTNGNDAVVEYNSASSTQTPVIVAQSRQGSTPLGSMDAGETVLASSTDVDVDFSCSSPYGPPCRWGDYSGATPDPVNSGVVWGSNMVNDQGIFGLPQWRSQNFALTTGGTVSPNFSLAVTPASQTVAAGSSTSYTVTVTPTGGFSGPVSLAVGGLPSGASGSFSPNPTTSTSTLTASTGPSTPAGSYPLTITGTNGSLSHTASATLVVNASSPPDFSLSASPSSRTVSQGNATSYSVTITPSNGFTGSVSLSLAGLPVGANGTFSPNPATTSATLNVTTNSTTPEGSYVLTITGTSGSLTRATTVNLAVTPAPDFSLSAAPSAASVAAGSRASYTVTINSVNGFSGAVTLSASSLPPKASASFNPDPATTSSTLTIRTNRGQTPPDSYTVTITGTSGGLTHSVTVNLVVT